MSVPGGGLLFFCQAEDGIRDATVTGVQTCALPISHEEFDGETAKTAGEHPVIGQGGAPQIEKRRVGEEGRFPGAPDPLKKKKKMNRHDVNTYITLHDDNSNLHSHRSF